MARTVVESQSKTAVIGFDEPFCVIGERINPTGRKKLASELESGNFTTVESDALAQVEAGANILDINAGVVYNSNPNPNETEPPLMVELVNLVQNLTDIPLCIDSSVPAALEAGLEVAQGRPLLNSVTGEEDRLDFVLPLVKKYNVLLLQYRMMIQAFRKIQMYGLWLRKKLLKELQISISPRMILWLIH